MTIAPSRFGFTIPVVFIVAGIADGYRCGFEDQDWLVWVVVGVAIMLGLLLWRSGGKLSFSEAGISSEARTLNYAEVARVDAIGAGSMFASNVRYEFFDDTGKRTFLIRLSAYGADAAKIDRHLQDGLRHCAGIECIAAGTATRLNALLMYAVVAALLVVIVLPALCN